MEKLTSGRYNLRGPRETLPTANGSSPPHPKKKWYNLVPLVVLFVVVAEIAFLGRLDIANNSAFVDSWADLLYRSPGITSEMAAGGGDDLSQGIEMGAGSCEEWLQREDMVVYSRDFNKDPIRVADSEKEWKACSVGCRFVSSSEKKKPDAGFGISQPVGTASVLRSMESAEYYIENNVAQARRNGYDIVMTTSLSSDVPVGYFSWAEYDIMAPVEPKTEKAIAAAFISNCEARNFRLQALETLEKAKIEIDSYGNCHRNHDGQVDKVETLKRYKFSLAFENSNEEDYVTEKFFQSLVAGSVPVVIGAPNIQEFAPSPGSLLHIKDLSDVAEVSKTMKYLSENPKAYNETLRWKSEGPSDSFKALVDMAAVHSSCRLCVHLATAIQEKEEKSPSFKERPCNCTRGSETVHHIYVRERGRFKMESLFLRSLTLEALESAVLKKFNSLKHVPIWKQERPDSIRGGNALKVYRIYPLGLTQRQALYTFRFSSDSDLKAHVENNPCAKFEVIFV
ncbi:hypothetical protein SAY86_018318 [Trapa natans]|uniref:Fucosyltransferase n=1 Tax=Trapa natans TaxID=22666 RepID=A0AAN7R0V5_TRANT|nr:hypothetical protein SAY86_018318 [Trapa natans]